MRGWLASFSKQWKYVLNQNAVLKEKAFIVHGI